MLKISLRYHLLFALVLVIACSYFLRGKGGAQPMPENSPYLRNLTMTSKFLAADFIPDGDLSKKVWKEAPHVMLDRDRSGHPTYPDSEVLVASLWTPDYVYFAYHCRYRSLNIYAGEDPAKERWELWNRDVVEVFINPHPQNFRHYYEFEMAPNNQWIDLKIDLTKKEMADAAWDSHFEHAAKIDAERKVWVVEMRIPVKSMNANPIHPGDEWRLNLYRCDGPGDDTQRRFMSWSALPPGNDGSFHQPASFGIIKFVK
jgi:alpha-galactosidase